MLWKGSRKHFATRESKLSCNYWALHLRRQKNKEVFIVICNCAQFHCVLGKFSQYVKKLWKNRFKTFWRHESYIFFGGLVLRSADDRQVGATTYVAHTHSRHVTQAEIYGSQQVRIPGSRDFLGVCYQAISWETFSRLKKFGIALRFDLCTLLVIRNTWTPPRHHRSQLKLQELAFCKQSIILRLKVPPSWILRLSGNIPL